MDMNAIQATTQVAVLINQELMATGYTRTFETSQIYTTMTPPETIINKLCSAS